MLKLPSLGEIDSGIGVRIYLSTAPTDMRKGFDSLASLVREGLGYDPLSGHLFLFVGRHKDRLKLLYWDKDGFALWYKRLEEGTFRLPAAKSEIGRGGKVGASRCTRIPGSAAFQLNESSRRAMRSAKTPIAGTWLTQPPTPTTNQSQYPSRARSFCRC